MTFSFIVINGFYFPLFYVTIFKKMGGYNK